MASSRSHRVLRLGRGAPDDPFGHKGITDKDLELAKKIEEVVQWQPAARPATRWKARPPDPRFAYIKYD